MKAFTKICKTAVISGIVMASALLLGSCFREDAPTHYYTFTGKTIADYLSDDPENFSDFITVLKRSEIWGELDTYGEFTCFAPTNDAFKAYLKAKERKSADEGSPRIYNTVDDLSREDCDTLGWTHLIRATLFMSDQVEGSLPSVNMNNRFLTLSFDSVLSEDGSRYRLRHCINKNSHIIELDDTVQNGVMQIVDSVITVSGDYIYDMIKNDPKLSIFASALQLVGLEDSLKYWKDETYHISDDSVEEGIWGDGGGSQYHVYYWGERRVNFTVLAETDDVLAKYGITSIDSLISYSKRIYGASYPEDAGTYDEEDYHDRRHPLNRFISYHILPFAVPSSANFNCRPDIIQSRCILEFIDPEDYFETYMPHSIIRVSSVKSGDNYGVYVNRRGIGTSDVEFEDKPNVRGVKVLSATEMNDVENEGCNGYYHYIDDILTYDVNTRYDVLNRRIRIDCCTLSPDFMTSGARQIAQKNTGFKQPLNFHSYTDDYIMWVRQAVTGNWSYQGDGLDLQGNFDLYLKLPPVPFDGTWELRLSYRGFENCGVVQNYVGDSPYTLQPCGIPTDLRLAANTNPNIGWVSDDELMEEGGEEAVKALDKAMHNRGYMKGPDSHTNGSDAFRTLSTMARRIITTQYFYSGKDYYLRMKLVSDNPKAEMNFDYMEWCPKSVYDYNEDKH